MLHSRHCWPDFFGLVVFILSDKSVQFNTFADFLTFLPSKEGHVFIAVCVCVSVCAKYLKKL